MTIDAAKFESQGLPTKDQVRVVWDAAARPSARSVADVLTKRGFKISWRTVARWRAHNWREERPNAIPLAEKGSVRGVKREVKAALKQIPADQVEGANAIARAVASTPNMDELSIIEARRAELMLKSEAELDVTEAKARKVYNILLMEQAARRAHIMVLIPKETAALVDSMSEAANVKLTGGEGQPPAGDDARIINGTTNPLQPEQPENEVASAINDFLRKEEAA